MKVIPSKNTVQLKIMDAKAGDLVTSSRESAVEYAEVIAIGENVFSLKVGDCIFVKAWAVDIITHNDERFYFCNLETNGILAKVK